MPSLYEKPLEKTIERFPGNIQGSNDAAFCVICSTALSPEAKQAISASMARLGYLPQQGCLISLSTSDSPNATANSTTEIPATLLEIIEALDPLVCIITDHEAIEAASQAYHKPLKLEAPENLLGRQVRCFNDFEALLATDADKQRLWRSLRSLPIRAV